MHPRTRSRSHRIGRWFRNPVRNRARSRGNDRRSGIGATGDRGTPKRRNELGDGIAEGHAAVLDEHESRDARQRLRLRRDAKERVGCHAAIRFPVRETNGALVHDMVIAQDEHDGAADATILRRTIQQRIESSQSRRGTPPVAPQCVRVSTAPLRHQPMVQRAPQCRRAS